jgi:hypothetical protein
VQDQYPGIVLENEYIRLVILPEFGARIISFYYKPTGHEQFYTNPVGTPYGMGDGNFYYDWLMVFGGVFPTFPEPEHGKTWFLPWQWEFTEISDEKVSLSMELQDTIDFPSHPGKFNYGITHAKCISTVTLQSGKTSFEFHHSIENTKNAAISMEYWTCCTFSPGSVPGNTYTPANSEIVAPIEYVYLKDDWWSWMGDAEIPAANMGSHVFEYENLAFYENWEDMGIAYAYPALDRNYYGVINHENGEGVFRVVNNSDITKGMKFWTWGAQQGLNADPGNFYQVARPYIELWSGLSTQFFENAILSPNETVSWNETYLPTLEMDSISYVNENGAIHLGYINDNPERFLLKLFTTEPDREYHLNVSLNGQFQVNLYDGEIFSENTNCNQLTFLLDDYFIEDGGYDYVATLLDIFGDTLMEYSIPVTVPFPHEGIHISEHPLPQISRISPNTIRIGFDETEERHISVYSMNGQLIHNKIIYDRYTYLRIDHSGFYIISYTEGGSSYSFKVVI